MFQCSFVALEPLSSHCSTVASFDLLAPETSKLFWFVVLVQLPTEFANQASEVPQPSRVWFDIETSSLTVCDDAGAVKSMVRASVRQTRDAGVE